MSSPASLSRWIPSATLLLISAAVANAVFRHGGLDREGWNISLVLVGLASVLLAVKSGVEPAPAPLGIIRWPLFLLPAYAMFQLAPLPAGLVQWLSPARVALAVSASSTGDRFLPLSLDPGATWEHILRFAGYIAMFLLARNAVFRTPASPWIPAIPLILVGAFEAALGLTQADGSNTLTGAYGTYLNRNHAAGLLEMVLPFAVMYSVTNFLAEGEELSVSRALRVCTGAGLAALIFVVLLRTLSRMALFSTLLAGLCLTVAAIWRRYPQGGRRRWIAPAFGLSALAVLLFILPPALVERLATLSAKDISVAERLQLWRQSMHLVREFPVFGCGLGSYATAIAPYRDSIPTFADYAHNDYLQYLIELGPLVWSLVVLCAGLTMFRLFRYVIRARSGANRSLAIASAASLLAMLLHSLADFNLYIPANALVFSWVAGIATSKIAFTAPRTVFVSAEPFVSRASPRPKPRARTAGPR